MADEKPKGLTPKEKEPPKEEPKITFEQFISTLDDSMGNKYADIILKGKAQECGSDLEPKSQVEWEQLLTKAKQL